MDSSVTFTGLSLVAKDADATIAFYRLLGVDIPETKIWRTATGAHHTTGARIGDAAELEVDSDALAREYNAGYKADPSASVTIFEFGLQSRDAVDAMYERLVAAGHVGRQPPYDAFWGARFAIVADPDGRDVGLMSPSDRSLGREPPAV